MSAARGRARGEPREISNLVIVTITTPNRGAVRALAYATSLRQPVVAPHISPTEDEAERMRRYWDAWGDHLPLEIIESRTARSCRRRSRTSKRSMSSARTRYATKTTTPVNRSREAACRTRSSKPSCTASPLASWAAA